MIQLIVQLFSTISSGFYYLFWTSYSIGKLISWIFCSILNILSYIWCNTVEAGTIFSEDFLIFLKDLIEVTRGILEAGNDSIKTSCIFLYSIVYGTFTTIAELFTTGNLHTANVGQQCVNSFAAMMNALKNLFLLLGNGMWFILTLIPNVLIALLTYIHHISKICFEIGWNFGEDVLANMKELTLASVNYFLDVPLQAIIGCGFIVLLVIYRRVTITFLTWMVIQLLQILRSRLLAVFSAIYLIFRRRNNNNGSRQIHQPHSRPPLSSIRSSTTKQNSPDDNCCVICRDEQRRVVLMPCRHMCLCTSCSLSATIRNCPLCRKPINNRLSVYT